MRKTLSTQFIVYHYNCLDGLLSAALTYVRMRYDCTAPIFFVPASYGDKPVDVLPGDTVYLVDFSYDRETIKNYIDNDCNVVVVDHHKTAMRDVLGEKAVEHIENNKDLYIEHPYLTACNCDKDNFSIFTSLIHRKVTPKGSSAAYFAHNEVEGKKDYHKRSAAGIVWSVLTDSEWMTALYGFKTEAKDVLSADIERIVELAQQHDLWLHKGDPNSQAMQLSYFFQTWRKENKELIEQDKKGEVTGSEDRFVQILASFFKTGLDQMLLIGKEKLDSDLSEIHELCKAAKEVQFFNDELSGFRVGHIESKEVNRLGISMTGSTLLKHYGFDVAVMSEPASSRSTIQYSLRSNSETTNVDVGSFCKALQMSEYAVSGGGHRNAAGIVISKDKPLFK